MGGLATIIGAGGFVGGRLAVRLAADGWETYAPAKGAADLFSRDLGVVYYCAGLTADYDRRPFDTVEAHASLASEIIRAGRFERIVYLSSTRLYDGLAKTEVDEAEPLVFDPTDPRRVYDLSKALGENLAMTRAEGRGRVARLANVYDWTDGAPGFLSEWLIRARSAKALTLESSPSVARDHIHLDDVVSALIAIAAAPEPAIFNVASGRLATNGQIAEVFARAGWTVRFTGEARPAPPPNAQVARLSALGVRPRPVEDVVGAYLQGLDA
ncbi:MAG TPA: NAD(P)-dependent oxidoreductase [Phenylobacterium sp.]|nr:NAD(P)-dependent oxidoreductase [Phenylobacterium sp.]